jgi:hypothetical protein
MCLAIYHEEAGDDWLELDRKVYQVRIPLHIANLSMFQNPTRIDTAELCMELRSNISSPLAVLGLKGESGS